MLFALLFARGRGMIICPYCQAENIEGADECVECNESLVDLSIRVPASLG